MPAKAKKTETEQMRGYQSKKQAAKGAEKGSYQDRRDPVFKHAATGWAARNETRSKHQ